MPDRLPDLELKGYLHRWCMIQRSRNGNQYLHHILAPDEPVLHDHPWDFKSMILSGGYVEMTVDGEVERNAGDVYEKKATELHYITEVQSDTWTMIFTGRSIRNWGFFQAGRWISHSDFTGRRVESIFRNGYSEEQV